MPTVIKEIKRGPIPEYCGVIMHNNLSVYTGSLGSVRWFPLLTDFMCILCMSDCVCVYSASFGEHWGQESKYRFPLVNLKTFISLFIPINVFTSFDSRKHSPPHFLNHGSPGKTDQMSLLLHYFMHYWNQLHMHCTWMFHWVWSKNEHSPPGQYPLRFLGWQ